MENQKSRKRFGGFFVRMLPLAQDDASRLNSFSEHFSEADIRELEYLLKSHKARFASESFDTSHALDDSSYSILASNSADTDVRARIEEYNEAFRSIGKEQVFRRFSEVAESRLLAMVAPDIIGMDEVKRAALLQLFSKEKLHILLLGDPSTGKTVILRSISELAPVSSFGLGSGASKAGLTLAFSGKEMTKGILPLADGGIACIDELNLLKNTDRAGLLNAMEKGFITYDKGNNHLQVEARVKVFATANPIGDKFVGKTIEVLKKQVPFEQALLTRFHLVFLVRRPSDEEFKRIAGNLIEGKKRHHDAHDAEFVKQYIDFALKTEVSFDKSLSPLIQDFVSQARKDEDRFLVEISPRMVIGMVNMAKASARMSLRDKVAKQDVLRVVGIFRNSLYIKKEELER